MPIEDFIYVRSYVVAYVSHLLLEVLNKGDALVVAVSNPRQRVKNKRVQWDTIARKPAK